MRSILLSNLLLLMTLFTYAQEYTLSGRVIDAETNEPLAFVSILVMGDKAGCYSDIDGKFALICKKKAESIRASYVGYETKEYYPGDRKTNLVVRLKKVSIELTGVVIQPKANPANRIILRCVENRDQNDPEKLRSFSYTAYEKFVFTTNVDSILKLTQEPGDSSILGAQKFLRKQDFAIIENIAERKFNFPDIDHQQVVATKISGFKDPIFVFLLSQLQSNSFYKELIKIGDLNYVNPVSKGSINKYYFHIQDTIYSNDLRDTTFVISFRPFRNMNFEGLRGVLYINTSTYAVQNVIASPENSAGGMNMKIQQMYERVDGIHWFPTQLNTDIEFNTAELKLGKRTFHVIGTGKSYIRDIRINQDSLKKHFNEVQIYVVPDATKRDKDYWDRFRQDSLSSRDKNTYHFMDSLGGKYNFDKYARTFETLMTGKIPWHFINIDINKLFRFNDFEGYYLGLGLTTNDKISRFFRIGGYGGYGFRDRTVKYGAELGLNLDREHQAELVYNYKNDVKESGGVQFFEEDRFSITDRIRNFLVNRMDRVEINEMRLAFRAFRYFKWNLGFRQEFVSSAIPYYFSSTELRSGTDVEKYRLSALFAETRFVYKEKFLKNSRTQISLGSDWPVIRFQYTHALKGILNGDFAFERFDLNLIKHFISKYWGKTSISLNAGYIDGNLPAGELYNGHGSFRELTIYAPNSFSTMRMNEFLSNRYVAAYFTHNFGKLLFRGGKVFHPEFAFCANAGFGTLNNPGNHHNSTFTSMEQGYFESGLLLNNLVNVQFYGLGIGVFYRYGPYSFENWKDNVAVKFTFGMPF